MEESLEVLAAAAGEGVTAIAATPHVGARYPIAPAEMERAVAATAAAAEAAEIPLRVLQGGEVELAWLPQLSDDELRRFSLGGSGRYLLVELSWDGWLPDALELIDRVAGVGLRPVIAHPERHVEVQEQPGRLQALVGGGVLLQVTASSLEGLHGRRAQRTAQDLLRYGMVHLVASDRHGPRMRRATMEHAYRALGGGELAERLTVEVPAAIVAGDDLPD
jgi:protein-tyrosine phosphatase